MSDAIVHGAGAVLLVVLFAVCVWGMLSRKFVDNLLQRIGLALLALVFFMTWAVATEREAITRLDVALYLGLLIYALGTIRKVARFMRYAPPATKARRTWGGAAAAFSRDVKR